MLLVNPLCSAEEKQKREQQKQQRGREGGALRRSKTFVSLLFRGARRREASRDHKEPGGAGRHKGRSKSPSQDKEPFPGLALLDAVEDMAEKLLEKDEVVAVLRHCRRVSSIGWHALNDHSECDPVRLVPHSQTNGFLMRIVDCASMCSMIGLMITHNGVTETEYPCTDEYNVSESQNH